MTGRLIIVKRLQKELGKFNIEYEFGYNGTELKGYHDKEVRYSKCSFVIDNGNGLTVIDLAARRDDPDNGEVAGYIIHTRNDFLDLYDKLDYCNRTNKKLFDKVFVDDEMTIEDKEDIEAVVSKIIEFLLR